MPEHAEREGQRLHLARLLVNHLERGDEPGALHEMLSEVLLAQGYQDITGQVICKVIALVKDVECKLVALVRLSGERLAETPVERASRDISAQGPAVPGVDRGDVVNTQDDVDELLSGLGF